jgi:hypothetical protein
MIFILGDISPAPIRIAVKLGRWSDMDFSTAAVRIKRYWRRVSIGGVNIEKSASILSRRDAMKYGADPRPQIREEGSTHTTTRSWQEWTHPGPPSGCRGLDRLTTDLSARGCQRSLFCSPAPQGARFHNGLHVSMRLNLSDL